MPGPIIHALVTLLQLYSFVILARILLSWFPNVNRSNPLVDALHRVTDPVLIPARNVIPPLGMIDISPIVVFIAIRILTRVLWSLAV